MQLNKGFIRILRSRSGIACMCVVALLTSCKPGQDANIPDVSKIDVDIDITRFEQLLLADGVFDAAEMQQLSTTHPAFTAVYMNHVMPGSDDIAVINDPELKIQHVQSWINHPRTRWLYDTIQQVFPDLTEVEEGLESAFRYGKYYFPDRPTPRVYTTISDFGYFPFIYAEDSIQDGIGISLEMFLGEDFPYLSYTGLNNAFSDYLTRSYNKQHVVKRAIEVWVDDIAGAVTGDRLIDHMMHNGKKLYILSQLMPEAHDSVIIDYPSDKLEWARSNERNIWYQFTTENLLYETSLKKIQKYIGPSPTSPGMPPQSPGNTGSWLGWQIIKTYMAKHPNTTFQQLLGLKDAQKILEDSGYKPPR